MEIHPLIEVEDAPNAQGDEGRRVHENITVAMRQWYDRANGLANSQTFDDSTYRHVPFQIVGTRQIRYVKVEPLRPRRIAIDDEQP